MSVNKLLLPFRLIRCQRAAHIGNGQGQPIVNWAFELNKLFEFLGRWERKIISSF